MAHELHIVQLMSRTEIYPDKTSGKLILATIGQSIKVPLVGRDVSQNMSLYVKKATEAFW